jgi:hypothetical protein
MGMFLADPAAGMTSSAAKRTRRLGKNAIIAQTLGRRERIRRFDLPDEPKNRRDE